MTSVPFYGAVTACIDNPLLAAILPRARRRVFTYGVAAEADYRLTFTREGKNGQGIMGVLRVSVCSRRTALSVHLS